MEGLTGRKNFCPPSFAITLGIHLFAQASFCPMVFIRFARPRISARDRRSCQNSRHIPCMECAATCCPLPWLLTALLIETDAQILIQAS